MSLLFPQFPPVVACNAIANTFPKAHSGGGSMKIWTLSDLHLSGDLGKFGDKLKIPAADLCVVAGDLSDDLDASFAWMYRILRPHMPVIYVLGNHDVFGRELDHVVAEARTLADNTGIVLLENDALTCRRDGEQVRFVGATLWTDFALHGDQELAFEQLSHAMPEYQWCRAHGNQPMGPKDAYRLHCRSRAFFEKVLAMPFEGKTVVVSHHCPHPNSILERFRGDTINPAFTSDLSDLIETYRPDLWIHGHTHASFDYTVGDTRILCNPRGNGGNKSFDWRKVVSV